MFDPYDKAPLESSPTNPIEFEDHRRQLLQKLVETNTMGKLAALTMRVVSTPVLTSRMTTSGLTSATAGGGPAVILGGTAVDSLTQMLFRGRIEPGDGYISPHYMWDDPCDVSLFKGDNDRLLAAIANHTLCISKPGYSGVTPKVGDKVTVLVKPSDVGPIALQILHFQDLEDVIPPEQAAMASSESLIQCGGLTSLFDPLGSGGFTSNINLTPPLFGNSTRYPQPVPASRQYPYAGTIAERIADDDRSDVEGQGLWPAKVWFSETDFVEVEGFYSPIVKGLPVTSLPQKARPVPYDRSKEQPHPGVDVGTGGSGDIPLYPSLPGIIFRGANFQSGQPNTTAIAIICVVSPIEFQDGTKMTLTSRLIHMSRFSGDTNNGDHARWSPGELPQPVGLSGGAKGQVGSGGTTGPHLHWELRQSDFNKTITRIPHSGWGGDPLDCSYIYVGKSINPTNGSTTRTGAPPPEYDDFDLITTYPEAEDEEGPWNSDDAYASETVDETSSTESTELYRPSSGMVETSVEG